jgi:CelD/BcsL family acetyltransferase involved in cellulose biosynthesis
MRARAMRDLSIDELEARADELDHDVVRTPGIDRFCSSSAWVLPAARALMPPRQSWILRGDHGWLTTMLGRHPSGIAYVEPMELAWGMACPLIGEDPQALAGEAASEIAARRDWNVMLLAGMTADGTLLPALLRALPPRIERRFGQSTIRLVASLDDGVEGFLGRRTRNFRKALRAAARDADAAGITFESVKLDRAEDADALYARILDVEVRSWKGEEGVGIHQGPMNRFYGEMLPRLAARGRQRTWFARQSGRDVAYCMGAVFDNEYRGLQFSYDRAMERYSLGSLLQMRQIEELVDERVQRYDLGQDMEYKRRWAEEAFETVLLVLVNR